jgi:hypothetical protein
MSDVYQNAAFFLIERHESVELLDEENGNLVIHYLSNGKYAVSEWDEGCFDEQFNTVVDLTNAKNIIKRWFRNLDKLNSL